MKKIITIILAVFTVASLCSVFASADAYNPADGCKMTVDIKKADSANVIKDGVIGEGEYEEIAINRNSDETDCLISWHGNGSLYDTACEFLQNVHFYMSWDEVHGLNVAVKCRMIEEPNQVNEQPADDKMSYEGDTFPGDEFIAQCGVMFDVRPNKDDTSGRDMIYYRGIARRTDNGEYLIGHYGETSQGYDYKAPKLTPGEDLIIVYGEDHWVTYEFSVPITSVVANASAVGETFDFNISAVGGGVGKCFENNAQVYAISIGDEGYMMSKNEATEISPVHGTFTSTLLVSSSEGGSGDGESGKGDTDIGGNGGTVTSGDTNTNAGDTSPVTNGNGTTENRTSTKTGDAVIATALISVISAVGIVIAKKKSR